MKVGHETTNDDFETLDLELGLSSSYLDFGCVCSVQYTLYTPLL